MNALLILFGLFLLVSAGAMVVATLTSRNRTYIIGAIVASVLGIASIILGLMIVSVGPNERMVVFNRINGKLSDPREPGITLINPLTTAYRIYDVSRQTYTMSQLQSEGDIFGDDAVVGRTSGGQEVFIDVTVIYRIDPTQINEVHVNWPNDRYRTELIRPLMRSVIRDAVSLFSAENIYQERQTIDAQIEDSVIPAMETEGFIVEEILVRNVTFTEEYAASIEAAQIAEVRIRQEEFRVREVEQQAEQARAEAQGRADARLIEAEAEARALELIAEALQDNPSLLEYQYVQNLSDNVQVMALPASSPYLFDLESVFRLGQSNTAAPQTAPPPAQSDTEDN